MTHRRLFFISLIGTTALFSCGDSDGPFDFEDGTCEAGEAAFFVQAVTEDWYLYPDQIPLPGLDYEAFETSRDFLRALIEDVDLAPESPDVFAEDRFSFVTTVQSFEVGFTGNFVGIGISYFLEGDVGNRGLRLLDVFGANPLENPTPAGEAGLQRADRIIGINGSSVEDIIVNRPEGQSEFGAISNAFGTGEEGEEVQLEIERPDLTRFDATVVRRPIEQTEVPIAEILDRPEGSVGYMVFRGFTPSSAEDLRRAFVQFEAAGLTELIVDLRYNGGGLISVATYFANLLAGPQADNETFVRFAYNDMQADRSTTTRFDGTPSCPSGLECDGDSTPLSNLERLVFITTGGTASASEMLINGLSPFVEVDLVGSSTFGKPVGFLNFQHEDCDQVYGPTTLKTVNAENDGDFFDGLPVTCEASDDFTRRFGDPEEDSLAAALSILETDSCPTPPVASLRSFQPSSGPRLSYGAYFERENVQ